MAIKLSNSDFTVFLQNKAPPKVCLFGKFGGKYALGGARRCRLPEKVNLP